MFAQTSPEIPFQSKLNTCKVSFESPIAFVRADKALIENENTYIIINNHSKVYFFCILFIEPVSLFKQFPDKFNFCSLSLVLKKEIMLLTHSPFMLLLLRFNSY